MLDPELSEKLDIINRNLESINKKLQPTRWRLFAQGLWRAVGYLIGLVVAIALVGWMLNIIGVIPLFQNIALNLSEILNRI